MCFISIESRASASAAFITFYQRGNTRGRTKTKQKTKNQPIKVGMRWDVGAQAVLRPLWTQRSHNRAAGLWRRAEGTDRDTRGGNFVKESVWHKHKIHSSKQLHEKNCFDSVIAIPQSQQPSVHKAVPISPSLLKHTEDVKTVGIISAGFQKLQMVGKEQAETYFYSVFSEVSLSFLFSAVFYSQVVMPDAAY